MPDDARIIGAKYIIFGMQMTLSREGTRWHIYLSNESAGCAIRRDSRKWKARSFLILRYILDLWMCNRSNGISITRSNGVTEYRLRSNGISPLRGNILSSTEDISYPLPVTYHIPIYWNTIFKDPPPLDCQKTPLGTKSRKTHGLFWPKLNF